LALPDVAAVSIASGPGLRAQLAAPGESGVVMGHLHLAARDLDAQRKFWGELGGTPVQNGPLALIQLPGTFVMLRQAEPAGGTVGSTINHVGFLVKDIAPWITKWKAAGLTMEPQARPTQVYLIGPDDVRVEILEDKTIDVPLKMHHAHYYIASPLETQAWYAKTFGTSSKPSTPTVATMGLSLDHIGLELRGLDAFCKKLEAGGIKLDRPYTRIPNSNTAIAFLTDPWGTYIELTENLAPAK
jgi:catechol 2,3-dioxygenase-like lactoylglutathione lyase family enzyme